MVIICGAELFTGNTALMAAAYWEGKATAFQVAKNWIVSYMGVPLHPKPTSRESLFFKALPARQ